MGVLYSCRNYHPSKLTPDVGNGLVALLFDQKLVWVRVLLQLSLVNDQDSISINNRGKPMCDNEDRRVVEPFSQSALNQVFGLYVNLSV